MLNAEIKETWVKALRSGDYEQGQMVLKQEVNGEFKYCCMGVLMEINDFHSSPSDIQALPGAIIHRYPVKPNSNFYCSGMPPMEFSNKIGLSYQEQINLQRMNDREGKSFNEIADYIEQNL